MNQTARTHSDRWSFTRLVCATFTGLTVGSVVLMALLFAAQSVPVWRHAGPEYIVGGDWFYRQELFGAASMIYGTVVVAAIAVAIATPLGLGAAIGTAELLPARARLWVKGAIELLAGIPSVVYGLLGVLFLRGWVDDALRSAGYEPIGGDTLFTAGLLLAVMVLPTIVTLADDALRAVPGSQRAAARGLGMTRAETVLSVCVPQAGRGIFAAVLLALGRALGETIAVFLVVGRQDGQWPAHLLSFERLFEPGQTLSSKLGGAETNIAYGDPLHWGAMVGLGLLLFCLVTFASFVSGWLQKRGGQVA